MADIEITDEASLEAWLKKRPRRDAEVIAFRAAARVFPLWGSATDEVWAKTHNLTSLPALHILFLMYPSNRQRAAELETRESHAVSRAMRTTELAKTISFVMDTPKIKALGRIATTFNNLGNTERSSVASGITGNANVHEVTNAAEWYSAGFDDGRSWQAISADAIALYTGADHSRLPLWPTPAPEWFTTADRETRAIWAKDPATWAFWEKWWDGVISGDMPFAPDLLRDVALIEDDIWQAGPKAVAEHINLLIQRHALQREAAAIHARLMEFIAFNEGLGANLHNNPPDDELSPVKLRATLGEISQALKEIEVALDGPEISPEVVAGLGQRLKDLWDGLIARVKFAVQVIAISILTSVGTDIYQSIKANLDIPSFSRRLLEFGKELEKPRNPAPVFPPRSPIDL